MKPGYNQSTKTISRLRSALHTCVCFSVLYAHVGFRNSGWTLEFRSLVGIGRSGWMIGSLCLNMVPKFLQGSELCPKNMYISRLLNSRVLKFERNMENILHTPPSTIIRKTIGARDTRISYVFPRLSLLFSITLFFPLVFEYSISYHRHGGGCKNT